MEAAGAIAARGGAGTAELATRPPGVAPVLVGDGGRGATDSKAGVDERGRRRARRTGGREAEEGAWVEKVVEERERVCELGACVGSTREASKAHSPPTS